MTVSEAAPPAPPGARTIAGDPAERSPASAPLALAIALGAGVLVAVVARAIETSRLAWGPYAFYGNGALIVPAVLMPLAIYGLWAWILRDPRPLPAVVASVAGLWAGFGVALSLATYGWAVRPDIVPFLFGNGLIWAALPALVMGVVVTAARRAGPVVLVALAVLGLVPSLILPMIGLPITAGAFTVAGIRAAAPRAIALGAVLLLVELAGSLAIPLLFLR